MFDVRSGLSRSVARTPRPSLHRAFSLTELLIVIGILVLLIGLTLPAILYAKKRAVITRTQADLALIGTALEAYKTDFGDYPRFAKPMDDQYAANNAIPGNGTWLDYKPAGMTGSDRGARLLCFALMAPGPEAVPSHPVGTYGTAMPGEDGANGPGFRVRRIVIGAGTSTPSLGGKIYPPYIDSSKFKLEYTPGDPSMQDAKILDSNGNPILYYPAMPGPAHITAPFGYVWSVDPQAYLPQSLGSQTTATSATPLYNAFDNTMDTTPGSRQPFGGLMLSQADMQKILGDADNSGAIDNNNPAAPPETATTTLPYLLWTAGFDGRYGIDPATGKTDDICNFDIPANLKK